MPKNIIFAGTPDFASAHLQALIDNGCPPSLVLTQPDRASGRGRKLTPSPVKVSAKAHNIPIFQPEKLDDEAKVFLEQQPQPDLLIVVAYGLLLPQWALDWAKHGAINVHASLLPRWRGAAPIQRAIEAGDAESGVGIMQMDIGLDTGDIWSEARVAITDTMNAGELHDALQNAGTQTLLNTLPVIFAGHEKPTPQREDGITYAQKLSKTEAQINWHETPDSICRKIRAFNPVPIAHSATDKNWRFRFYQATPKKTTHDKPFGTVLSEDKDGIIIASKAGAVCVTEIQEIGKKRLAVHDFLNGKSLLGELFV